MKKSRKGSPKKSAAKKNPKNQTVSKASGARQVVSKTSRARQGSPASATVDYVSSTEGELSLAGKIAWYTLLALVFFVPLAMSNFQFLGIPVPLNQDVYDTIKVTLLRLGSIVAFIAWVYDLLKNGGKIRYSPVFWVGGAFLIWATISTFTSVSFPISFFGKYRRYEGLWSYFIYAVLFFLAMQYVVDGKRLKQIVQALVFSSGAVAFYGLLQAVGFDPIMVGTAGFEAGRSYSTYGNPDLLAGFLAFGVFVTFGLALAEDLRPMRIIYWAILLANSAVVITAFSRSIWVGFAVGIVFMVLFALRHRKPLVIPDWFFLGGLAIGTAGFAGSSLSNPDAVTNFGQRVMSIFDFKTGSALTRFEIWDAATKATLDRPFFGFGPDTFRLIFRRFAPVEYARDAGYRSVADNVHNYTLQLSASVGIVGMLLYYALAFWIAVKGFTLCMSRDYEVISRTERIMYAGIWSACIAYMTHLFFGLSLPGGTFLLFLAMGMLVARGAKEIEVAPNKFVIPVVVSLSLMGSFAGGLALSIFVADHSYAWASEHEYVGRRTAAIEAMRKAVKQNPYNDFYKSELFRMHSAYALDSFEALSGATNTVELRSPQEVEVLFEESIELGKEAIEFMPWESDNYALLGAFYNQLAYARKNPGYFEESIILLEPQIKLKPTALALRFVYGQSLIGIGRIDEGLKELKLCFEQDPNFTDAKTLYETVSLETSKAVK